MTTSLGYQAPLLPQSAWGGVQSHGSSPFSGPQGTKWPQFQVEKMGSGPWELPGQDALSDEP